MLQLLVQFPKMDLMASITFTYSISLHINQQKPIVVVE